MRPLPCIPVGPVERICTFINRNFAICIVERRFKTMSFSPCIRFLLGIWLAGAGIAAPLAAQPDLPVKPLLESASVDTATGDVVLKWKASSTPGIPFYKIYRLDITDYPPTGTLIDSVPGGTLEYRHTVVPYEPFFYTITAVDSSGNESLLSGDTHRPLKVEPGYDSCAQVIALEWNRYVGWKENLSGYRVYRCEPGAGCDLRAMLDTTELYFEDGPVEENRSYSYVIEAFDNTGKEVSSNIGTYYTYMPPPPAYINLDYVTVKDRSTVEISFTADISGEVNDFRIGRAGSAGSGFSEVATYMDLGTTGVTLEDQVPTSATSYYYRVDALNSCGDPVFSSNTGRNILLSGTSVDNRVELSWLPYETYKAGIESYVIYRMNASGTYEEIDRVSGNTVSYQAELILAEGDPMVGEVCFYVEALEAGGNPQGVNGISSSNRVCVAVETHMFFPNAFTPNDDGQNDLFLPVLDYTPEQYYMVIYDRSGQKMFESTDPYQGWNGTIPGGGKAGEGVYLFHVQYTSYSGVRQSKTGHLSLILP